MQHSQYRFKFYFNASHAIYLNGEMGESHPHTWEVILNAMKISDNFVAFHEIEKMCDTFLLGYKDVFMNTVQPFTTLNPTLENICIFFKQKIQEMLYEKGWLLLSIELSETPSRSYMISVTDELDSSKSFFDQKNDETLQEIVAKLAEKKIHYLINPDKPVGSSIPIKEENTSLRKASKKSEKSEAKKERRPFGIFGGKKKGK